MVSDDRRCRILIEKHEAGSCIWLGLLREVIKTTGDQAGSENQRTYIHGYEATGK